MDPLQMNNQYPGVEKDQPELMQEMRDFMYQMNVQKGLSLLRLCFRTNVGRYQFHIRL